MRPDVAALSHGRDNVITLPANVAVLRRQDQEAFMSVRRAEAGDAVVGRNIRAHRLARHMSQSALARQLGLSFQQLQKYESGANRVGAARLVRIATALGVPVMTLLAGVAPGKGRDVASPVALIAHRHPLRLVEAFALIGDKRLRLALVALTESIARATRTS